MSDQQKWSQVTLKTKDLHIPKTCPNCMQPASNPVETANYGMGSGGVGRIYYCGNCVGAAESVNTLRGKLYLYIFVMLPLSLPLYYWAKKEAMRAYPKRSNQATWGYAAKPTRVSNIFNRYTFSAARAEWIKALVDANPTAQVVEQVLH